MKPERTTGKASGPDGTSGTTGEETRTADAGADSPGEVSKGPAGNVGKASKGRAGNVGEASREAR